MADCARAVTGLTYSAILPKRLAQGVVKTVPEEPLGEPQVVVSKRKRLNSDQKRERKAAAWQIFVKRIGRQAQRGVEPNDRKHSKKMAKSLRRMRPEEFDQLVRQGEDD